jgi:hypothetical protein
MKHIFSIFFVLLLVAISPENAFAQKKLFGGGVAVRENELRQSYVDEIVEKLDATEKKIEGVQKKQDEANALLLKMMEQNFKHRSELARLLKQTLDVQTLSYEASQAAASSSKKKPEEGGGKATKETQALIRQQSNIIGLTNTLLEQLLKETKLQNTLIESYLAPKS